MEGYKTMRSRVLACAMAALAAAALAAVSVLALAPQAAQADTNQAVLDQRSGIFKFNWGIDGQQYARGSAFLINEDTIVTAYHCVMPSSKELEYFGLTQQDVLDRSTYTVNVPGGFQVNAKLEKPSEEQDMAILKLDQKLNNVKSLSLRDSSNVDASEQVYALGFPASADQGAVITFTSNDVTVFDGTVSKPEAQMNYRDDTYANRSGSFLITTCRMDGGTSGGPMLDSNGNVVGVCVSGGNGYYYAAASDVLMAALDTMAYSYTKANGSSSNASSNQGETTYTLDFSKLNSAIGNAESVKESDYTAESYASMKSALDKAKDALKTELSNNKDKDAYEKAQKSIDETADNLNKAREALKEAPKGPDPVMIAIIAIAAVVVIAIIVAIILIMRNRKKKAAAAAAPPAPSPTVSGVSGVQQPVLDNGSSQSWQRPGPTATPASMEPETSVLEEEPNDTILLFQAASGGSLTRMSTNEQIPINSAEFVIGRERGKVDYCLEGNDAIGRVHVRIVVRDGKVYCVDNRAKNGTYVNGVKCRPGEEVQIKNGDIIMLADEKFKYNL